jgi:hypothetical protein
VSRRKCPQKSALGISNLVVSEVVVAQPALCLGQTVVHFLSVSALLGGSHSCEQLLAFDVMRDFALFEHVVIVTYIKRFVGRSSSLLTPQGSSTEYPELAQEDEKPRSATSSGATFYGRLEFCVELTDNPRLGCLAQPTVDSRRQR